MRRLLSTTLALVAISCGGTGDTSAPNDAGGSESSGGDALGTDASSGDDSTTATTTRDSSSADDTASEATSSTDATLPPTDVGDATILPPDAPDAAPLPNPCRGTTLPTDRSYVAPGLCAVAISKGVGSMRQITFAPNGDLFGVNAGGEIVRFRDVDGDGIYAAGAPETVNWANTGGDGNNCHIDVAGGYLYAGSPAGVKRWKWSNTIDAGGAGEDVMTGEPSDGSHPKHTVHVYGTMMYVQLGSAANVAMTTPGTTGFSSGWDVARSTIKRFSLTKFTPGKPFDWMADAEIVSVGMRNTVGFNADAAGRIYGVQNGQDNVTYGGVDVHADNPGEVIYRIEVGKRYGYPFCFHAERIVTAGGALLDSAKMVRSAIFAPNPHDDAWCQANTDPVATFMQAHTAPLDIIFYQGPDGGLPSRWKGGAFVAMHGSWDRVPSTGYKVIWVPFDASGNSAMPTTSADKATTNFPSEVVFGGGAAGAPKDGAWSWSAAGGFGESPRPVGVAVSPIDGALYISTDSSIGYLYRVGIPR